VKVYLSLLSAVTDCCVAAALLRPAAFGGSCPNRNPHASQRTSHTSHLFQVDCKAVQRVSRYSNYPTVLTSTQHNSGTQPEDLVPFHTKLFL